MGKEFLLYALLTSLLLLFTFSTSGQKVKDGEFWKQQTLNDIIQPWQKAVFDQKDGGFHAYLKRDWSHYQFSKQYPGMIARQLYAFSTGYLLTAEPKYLLKAHQTFRYLKENAWDKKNGGWFYKLDDRGNPVKKKKPLVTQIHTLGGLLMYFNVTRNQRVKQYLDKTYRIANLHGWDSKHNGYFKVLSKKLSVKSHKKTLKPQLEMASEFLGPIYSITKKPEYLEEMERLMNIGWKKMRHPEYPWILENFSKDWQLSVGHQDVLKIGPNLEAIKTMLKAYQYTDQEDYRENALNLAKPLSKIGFNNATGGWYNLLNLENRETQEEATPNRVQAQGNMTQLYLYRVTGKKQYLKRFEKGAEFWNEHFLDKEYGGTFLKVHPNGKLADGDKASKKKTAYHATLHGLFNYVYTNLWVQDEPVNFHYRLAYPSGGETFYSSFRGDSAIRIKSVTINGNNWEDFKPKSGEILLPEEKIAKMQVTYHRKE